MLRYHINLLNEYKEVNGKNVWSIDLDDTDKHIKWIRCLVLKYLTDLLLHESDNIPFWIIRTGTKSKKASCNKKNRQSNNEWKTMK